MLSFTVSHDAIRRKRKGDFNQMAEKPRKAKTTAPATGSKVVHYKGRDMTFGEAKRINAQEPPLAAPQAPAAAPPAEGKRYRHWKMLPEKPDQATRDFLEVCYAIYKNHLGCNTPAEELIQDLVHVYGAHGAFTPIGVAECVQQFEDNFTEMCDTVKVFEKTYSPVMQAESIRMRQDRPAA
jgi:hypothetical protein